MATVMVTVAAVLVTAAVYLGSRGLRNFDSALIGYAVAIVVPRAGHRRRPGPGRLPVLHLAPVPGPRGPTGPRLGYDFVPLIALVAISVTELLLTFSSLLLDRRGGEFLAIIHIGAVGLALVFIPFGKSFHVIQRPAQVGVEVFKRTTAERSCT